MSNLTGNLAALVLVLGAIGTFLGGATAFLQFSFGSAKVAALDKKHRIVLGGGLFLLSLLLSVTAFIFSDDRPPHERLTTKAWAAYDDGDYETAIMFSKECIFKFSLLAEQEQKSLKEKNAPIPPTNSYTEDEAREIFSRGILNDVATAYFILGESSRKLERLDEARAAYQKAQTLDYARTWDPKEWFWSPATSASSQLAALGPKK